MIYDKTENALKYSGINEQLDSVLNKVKAGEYADLSTRRDYNDKTYCNPSGYTTSPEGADTFEAHVLYEDVQVCISGQEIIETADVSTLAFSHLDEANDCVFYKGECQTALRLKPGTFAVFFPGEGHRCSTMLEKPCRISKAVYKVKM